MKLILSACLLSVFTTTILAQSWTGTLSEGGVVQIDPTTNKATIYTDKGATQLWDGTHQLQDGSVIIVDEGVVTSGGGELQPEVLAPPAPPALEETTPQTSSACVELVIKVCGFNGECSDSPACSPARQLMELEKDEAWQTRSKGPNKTSGECRKALTNEDFFSQCEVHRQSDVPTACERLVTHVCGEDDQCAQSPACSPARQLLAMETQERLASRIPDRPTYTSGKCLQAFEDQQFFKRCKAP